MNPPIIYALDFDGVICDSAVETAITGWKAAISLWNDMPSAIPPTILQQFCTLRPLIETGYEAILIVRLLHLGESLDAIYQDYSHKIQALLHDDQLSVSDLKQRFGTTRDVWIANDLANWIQMNPLFEGVAAKLQTLTQQPWYIITTKQERFVKQILAANGIGLADECIYGLDRNMSKVDVLKSLLPRHPHTPLCFVEDRLPTLLTVLKQEELTDVHLVFALWGYNTAEEKALAQQQPITLQPLENFLELPCH